MKPGKEESSLTLHKCGIASMYSRQQEMFSPSSSMEGLTYHPGGDSKKDILIFVALPPKIIRLNKSLFESKYQNLKRFQKLQKRIMGLEMSEKYISPTNTSASSSGLLWIR
ncbi:unnamed protein product [Nezara viridula]|uniref:Uncharacterized protein n=1 Tax=Nezara viridula TaxID=85310 RepID=A0A9P0MP67_NEZVI|nr:unnamed protein product [Nezara viridula]